MIQLILAWLRLIHSDPVYEVTLHIDWGNCERKSKSRSYSWILPSILPDASVNQSINQNSQWETLPLMVAVIGRWLRRSLSYANEKNINTAERIHTIDERTPFSVLRLQQKSQAGMKTKRCCSTRSRARARCVCTLYTEISYYAISNEHFFVFYLIS